MKIALILILLIGCQTYRVEWKYNKTEGHGNCTSYELAKSWAEYGNSKYPELNHKVKPCKE